MTIVQAVLLVVLLAALIRMPTVWRSVDTVLYVIMVVVIVIGLLVFRWS